MNFSPTKQNKTNEFLWYFSIPLPHRNFEKKLRWFQARQKSEAECDSLLDSDFHFDGSLVEISTLFVSVDVGMLEAFWLVAFGQGGNVGIELEGTVKEYAIGTIYIYSSFNLNANDAGNMYI